MSELTRYQRSAGDQMTTFKLKCVGCKAIETRPAAECREQPFCKLCSMPMVLEKVTTK